MNPKPSLRVILTTLFLVQPLLASAGARKQLEFFFNRSQTFSANFEQVVLDEGLNTLEESSGQMTIERPNRFRWDYVPPFEQQIISDGIRIWIYDVELDQVTIKPFDKMLGHSPAVLLAGEGKIEDNYQLHELGVQGAVEWLALDPLEKGSHYRVIRLGFENSQLKILEFIDGLDQTTRITLTEIIENRPIDPGYFGFKPVPGLDVIDETR